MFNELTVFSLFYEMHFLASFHGPAGFRSLSVLLGWIPRSSCRWLKTRRRESSRRKKPH
jgi:hypothetical protein